MSPSFQRLSDTELDVLKCLWEGGSGTVRDVQGRLKKRRRTWAYTTVQTLLGRLVEKGFVATRKDGRAHEFRARVTQDDLVARQLDDLAERVCGGSATPLMLSLVQRNDFTKDEIQRFRELLDRIDAAEEEED